MANERWRDVIPERDFEVFEACGYGQRIGFGERAAILVIDVNVNFLGNKREPILESIKRFPYSCGEAGWDSLPHLGELIGRARAVGVPVAYSTGRWTSSAPDTGVLTAVNARHVELTADNHTGHAILDAIQPQANDIVLEKHYPSMFFGTPLMSYLNFLQVDTLLVTGCTTSGCVRATVVDGYSYNFRTCVIEECVFDRSQSSHDLALVDMDMKYADVISCDQAMAYLDASRQVAHSPIPAA
jgi:nicotinamidase-related amidase